MTSAPNLQLTLLGAMEALTRGPAGDRRLGKGKPVALLAFLSMAPGRRASRERLATLLWSDGSSEAARQNLRQTLWYLKRRLGEILVADDDSVALAPDSVCDVDTFVHAAQAERFADALAAYRGDLVAEFAAPGAAAFEEWADLERRRLRATFVGCVEAATRLLLGSGQAAQAIPLARRARELAPDDASTWRILLECLIAARDQLGAASAVAHLEAEIERGDIDADPAIRSLLRSARKLAGNGDVESSSAEGPDNSLVPDLIGREAEFRTLVDAWEGARRGRGRTLLLTGAAGLGKTRLLTDFAARVLSTRGRTVMVRAHQGNRGIPGSLAAQIAETLAALPGAAAISPGSASVLVALSPLLASAFPGATPDLATGDDAVRRRAAALGDLLGALCDSAALALLLDDAHWADAESLRIVGALRARVEGTRILLVAASRIPDALRHHIGSAEEIALAPFDVAGVAEFVGRLANLPTEPWSHGLVPRLHEASHGIPLLLIETLQGLVERGALERRDGQWFAKSADALQAAMPAGSALRARIASLDPVERTALVRLATLGRPIGVDELHGHEQADDWPAVLGALEKRSFVTRTENLVAVWHDEIARGVLDQASAAERLTAHGWASAVLSARARSLREHALATQHASLSADAARFAAAWEVGVRFARERGDDRPLSHIARELLGADASEELVRRAVRSAPFALRFGSRLRRAAVGAVAILFVGVAIAWVRRPAPAAMTVRLRYPADTTRIAVFDLPPVSTWQGEEPFVGRLVRRGRIAVALDGNTRGLQLIPGGRAWIGVRTFPDSGGDEWVRVGRDGVVERLSTAVGDDGFVMPLVDGSGSIANTRRFDRVLHESEVVLLDTAGRIVRRIASSDEEESNAVQSPDGTRIAFVRSFTTRIRASEVCVVHFDGRGEACIRADTAIAVPHVVAWSDPRTLLVQDLQDKDLFNVSVPDWRVTRLGDAPCQYFPWNTGGVLRAACVDPQSKESWAGVATIHAPFAVHPLLIDGRRLDSNGDAGLLDLASTGRRYLDRVTLQLGEKVLPVGFGGLARLVGEDASGEAIEVRAARYTTSDSTVVSVSDDGTLDAKREGSVWIIGTAGGWRTDSAEVRVRAFSPRTLMREDWSRGLPNQWAPFGDPAPAVGTLDGRPVLLPNGDGVWESGVVSSGSWQASQGVGIDAEVWLPVSLPKLQRLVVNIIASPQDAEVQRWQQQSPRGNIKVESLCAVQFPSGEGVAAASSVRAYSGNWANAAVLELRDRSSFFSGRLHRIRLQLTPDGRCALWVDGEFVGRTPDARPLPQRARVLIVGASVRTSIAVGGIEVWEGVKR